MTVPPFVDPCREAARRARVVAGIARDRWAPPQTWPALREMAARLDAAAAFFEAVPPGACEGVPAGAGVEVFLAEQVAVDHPAARFPAELGEYVLAPLVDRELPFPARLNPADLGFARRESELALALHLLHDDNEHQRERTEDWLREVFKVWQRHMRLADEVRVHNRRPRNRH